VGPSLYKAVISDHPVFLCLSGVGCQAAARAAERLVDLGAKELVSGGFCGALVPELHVGDLITDRVMTVNRPARAPQDRRALTELANAVAVDMETQAVVEAGTRRGVPIRFLRVISDEFQDDLTPLLGSKGSFSAWRMACRLFNPFVWRLASKLWRQSVVARARLADALQGLCG